VKEGIGPAAAKKRKHHMGDPRRGKPPWITMPRRWGEGYYELKRLTRKQGLSTICEEARCPNIGECWNERTATFLILGNRCTRRCTFCDVAYAWSGEVDAEEPRRLVEAVSTLGLRHVVITSVDRDDLEDGGASIFVECVRRLRRRSSRIRIELLIPDFAGKDGALEAVLQAGADVIAHNLETVAALYPGVRPRASYRGSLSVLRRAVEYRRAHGTPQTKTGIMVGLGERDEELQGLLEDVAHAEIDVLTIGQYLQPTAAHHRVERFYSPEEFEDLARRGRALGIPWVESGPLVRSSYHAAAQSEALG
jgi:lipoic acid synthetase